MNCLSIIDKYIELRSNSESKISELLSLFSEDAELISIDEKIYKNKKGLEEYYSIPQKYTPSISRPEFINGEYVIYLSFLFGLKQIKVSFEFDEDRLIKKIKLSNDGYI